MDESGLHVTNYRTCRLLHPVQCTGNDCKTRSPISTAKGNAHSLLCGLPASENFPSFKLSTCLNSSHSAPVFAGRVARRADPGTMDLHIRCLGAPSVSGRQLASTARQIVPLIHSMEHQILIRDHHARRFATRASPDQVPDDSEGGVMPDWRQFRADLIARTGACCSARSAACCSSKVGLNTRYG